MNPTIIALLAVLVQLTPLGAEHLRLYHIGNSLTMDSRPLDVAKTLQNSGHTVEQGCHISWGASLTDISADPATVDLAAPQPYGAWQNALSNYEWDAITIQAYRGGTGSSEVAATRAIIEQAIAGNRNRECNFFLYFAWPTKVPIGTFADRVMIPFLGDTASVFLSSGFLDYWHQELVSSFPELDIRVIPTGMALVNLDRKLREIGVSSYSQTFDLYRDFYHLNHAEGKHIALASMVAAISGTHPGKLKFPPSYIGSIDSEFAALAHDVVWYTLTADSRVKIEAPAEVEVRFNPSGNIHEVSFVGTLSYSTDLVNWLEIPGITSPTRFNAVGARGYFRCQIEDY